MTDRKNLKISTETYRMLRERKDQYETWDGFFHRLCGERTTIPQCADCGERRETVKKRSVHDELAPDGNGIIYLCEECHE